ncbi:hypothetical protein LZF95_15620 [Algoriphagus sp. AGSA1]|nr:hypothetical protein [Algoriphagus sp. AGSA1]
MWKKVRGSLRGLERKMSRSASAPRWKAQQFFSISKKVELVYHKKPDEFSSTGFIFFALN